MNLSSVALGIALSLALAAPAAAQSYAAHVPATDAQTPVRWGNSAKEAERNAMEACKRVSKLCASSGAWTDDLNVIFVTMCCKKPRNGCQTSSGATVFEAREASLKIFADAGYSNCTQRSALSTRDGKPVK